MQCRCRYGFESFPWSIPIVLVCCALCVPGCEPSPEELLAERQTKEALLAENLSQKHNAVRFPPESLGESAFTYEVQSFFATNAQGPVVFKGYLEDVEKTQRGIVVEFRCYLEDSPWYSDRWEGKILHTQLTASERDAREFLRVAQETRDELSRFARDPDYLVVARIDQVKRFKRYQTDWWSSPEDEIDEDVYPDQVTIEVFPDFVATGELLEAVHIADE